MKFNLKNSIMKEKIKALLGKIKLFFIEEHDYELTKWLQLNLYFLQFNFGGGVKYTPRYIDVVIRIWFLIVDFTIPIHKK